MYQDGAVALCRDMTLKEPRPLVPTSIKGMDRPLTGADIIDALELEIHRKYRNSGGLKAFARELGVDYLTYRRYIVHERKMSADLLMDSLAALGVDPVLFFTQLRERIAAEE